jgi:hypothetical protein
MTLSVGFRITVSLLILLPKLRGSDSYPGGTDSHRTRQPSLDAQRQLSGGLLSCLNTGADGFRIAPASNKTPAHGRGSVCESSTSHSILHPSSCTKSAALL